MMIEFEENIRKFSKTILSKLDHINNEQTTKISLINPFLRELGYDTTDPEEIVAEYTADIGAKAGEKVDYAILENNEPEILIECKSAHNQLSTDNIDQLYRYFISTSSKFGILTNGLQYWFFTDSDQDGRMDNKPFLRINLLDLNSRDVNELIKFTKKEYNQETLLERVDLLKYSGEIKCLFTEEFSDPSDELTQVLAKKVFDGRLTSKKLDMFKDIISKTFKEFIADTVESRLDKALSDNKSEIEEYSSVDEITDMPLSLETLIFKEAPYPVNSWVDLYIKLLELIYLENRSDFKKIFMLKGRKNDYFSADKNKVINPKLIKGSGIYADVNLSSNRILKRCKDVVALFGYSEEDDFSTKKTIYKVF